MFVFGRTFILISHISKVSKFDFHILEFDSLEHRWKILSVSYNEFGVGVVD